MAIRTSLLCGSLSQEPGQLRQAEAREAAEGELRYVQGEEDDEYDEAGEVGTRGDVDADEGDVVVYG
jgi:hypothetical protein